MDLTHQERREYTAMVDDILAHSDLSTISDKKIRKTLSEQTGKDLSEQKEALKALIIERFDRLTNGIKDESSEEASEPLANGHAKKHGVKQEPPESGDDAPTPTDRDSEPEDKRPKKKSRKAAQDTDAMLAARLQAEENSRSRPSRAGVVKKPSKVVKRKSPKKKSAAKIKADDDSDLELDSDGEKKAVNRSGGFHKEYNLSHALVQVVGDTKLSRPQAVKKIWAYIREHGLQDQADKRQIICDGRMQEVFKQDRVHMFTMNKLLGKHLYEIEEN